LEVLAINPSDSPERIRQYMTENRFTFKTATSQYPSWFVFFMGETRFDIAEQFGVSAFPTSIVIDSSGKVVGRMTGFAEADVRAALAQLGLK
jgi:thioredoxin-related protein